MSANPHANGGLLMRELRMPEFARYAVKVPKPGAVDAEATRVQGEFIRDVMKLNQDRRTSRLSPDETSLDRWSALFEVTDRDARPRHPERTTSTSLRTGRVMEMLSEHQCRAGW